MSCLMSSYSFCLSRDFVPANVKYYCVLSRLNKSTRLLARDEWKIKADEWKIFDFFFVNYSVPMSCSISPQISKSKFVTGVVMKAFVNATLTCLNVGMWEQMRDKYNSPVVFIYHCMSDSSLYFISTVLSRVRHQVVAHLTSEQITCNHLRFQVLTATCMKMAVLWDVALCSLVDIDRCFRGAYCLYYQGDDPRRQPSCIQLFAESCSWWFLLGRKSLTN
jgi:hypothetical protein